MKGVVVVILHDNDIKPLSKQLAIRVIWFHYCDDDDDDERINVESASKTFTDDMPFFVPYKYLHTIAPTHNANLIVFFVVFSPLSLHFVLSEFQIAGTSTEFVNKVLEKAKSGIPSGGLYDI